MTIRSMTGFGRCQREENGVSFAWEVRSVNNRFLDIKWSLPHSVRSMESGFEKILRSNALRGRVEVSLSLQLASAARSSLNMPLAHAMMDGLAALAASRGDSFAPDYMSLIHVSSLWSNECEDFDDALFAVLSEGLEAALNDWNASRETEAQRLFADLENRFASMKNWVASIEDRAPLIKQARFEQVRERLSAMLEAMGCELEENRFMQEIVIMADKLDVTEELTRLHAHFDRLQSLLQRGQDAGRKLDFTLQECFREINTCGNKIQDAQVSQLIVECKNELEKCREQVQNLE
ncbi:MAG: YicC family protein [Mailhella sp.]|nr:YicC family protein [Mailhella sp.]